MPSAEIHISALGVYTVVPQNDRTSGLIFPNQILRFALLHSE